jgi:hypothetical protein
MVGLSGVASTTFSHTKVNVRRDAGVASLKSRGLTRVPKVSVDYSVAGSKRTKLSKNSHSVNASTGANTSHTRGADQRDNA